MEEKSKILTTLFGTMAVAFSSNAQNPIIQTCYTANPAPIVYNDTLYLFTGHDEDDADDKGFKMRDYKLYTTTDMVNWTERGTVLSAKVFIDDDGKAYLYWGNNSFYYARLNKVN